MSTLLNQMRFLKLCVSPTFVVILVAVVKWLTIYSSFKMFIGMSFVFSVHFKSKHGESLSLFSTQPRDFRAFFTSGYPPLIMKTFVSSSTRYFFFQVAMSVMFKKT